uniref:Uncharacterized protein n=1 Tax=Rhizobium leguminosarum TaxID=384 RepID=A0A179BLT1_RHILE|nr:hypothetical protein A4U53_03590 [Rhizobium leguminosarum]
MLIVSHCFADRRLAHPALHTSAFRLAAAPPMFLLCSNEAIINLGKLLFKALLMNCHHEKAAPQAFQDAAR